MKSKLCQNNTSIIALEGMNMKDIGTLDEFFADSPEEEVVVFFAPDKIANDLSAAAIAEQESFIDSLKLMNPLGY